MANLLSPLAPAEASRSSIENDDEAFLRNHGWPLRTYFIALIVLLVVAAGGAAAYVGTQADHDARADARLEAAFAAKTAGTQLGNFLQAMRDTTTGLAANPAVVGALAHPKGCSLTFSGLAGPDGSHLDVVRSDGTVACTSRPAKAGSGRAPYATSSWLARALKGPVVVAPADDPRTGGRAMISAAPIPGGGGVVAAFGDVTNVAAKLVTLYGGVHGFEFLVTSDHGTVIARSIDPGRWIGRAVAGTQFGRSAGSIERPDLDGTMRLYASAAVPGVSWRFYAGEDRASALAANNRLKERQLLIILAGLAASILGAWLIYRRVVVPIKRLSGAVRSTIATPEPVAVSGSGPREVAGLAQDVNLLIASVQRELSERRRAEEQLVQSSKMEAIGHLAGGVAHDFNNLLTAIGGYGNLAREKSDDPEVVASLDEVLHAAERAGELTHQLLAFSRGQLLETKPLDPNEVVRETERLLRRMIGEDIRIVTSLATGVSAVLADAGQLSQVLINLAVNARDAMPDGGTLTIETANVDVDEDMAHVLFDAEPGAYVRISVTDTGVGIPEGVKLRLFEPFFTTKEVGDGTGLGLSTAYGIVRQSGGHMTVYSEPGHGAAFNVYLPQTAVQPAQAPPRQLTQPRGGTEHVLLVEDEQIVREVVTEMLERQGYKVTSSGDPQDALALCAAGSTYDLLITDVVMPKLNGHQLAQALTKHLPDLKVIFVSGYTSTTVVERGVPDVNVAFLQKPFAIGDLAAKVRQTLDQAA
jgi:signal transduction histidine kinase/ActR/RegA family two-component response regulator